MRSKTICQLITLLCFLLHKGFCNKKVYVEADQSCGETHELDAGDTFVIGQKRGPSKSLKAKCEITFTSASVEDEDRVCMEIEELQFQGNCYASLSIYDVMIGEGREKQLGAFDCHRTPPLEVCSIGKTLKMDLNRGYISFQRDLVLFLLQVYTKNPDAPMEDRVKEVPSVFHSVDTYIIILIVIAAVIVLVLITLVAVAIFCVRHKNRRSPRGGNPPVSTLSSNPTPHPLQTAVPRQDLKSGRMNTQEYYPLQPIPQRHYIGQRFPPFSYQAYTDQRWPGEEDRGYPSSAISQSVAGTQLTQSTPVSSHYQAYSLYDHPQTCNCYSYPAESLQPDHYNPNDGYASERYSGDTYERFSGEGYHSDSYLTDRYPQSYSLERYPHGVIRGYTGYPGITQPLVPGVFYGPNLGYRPGEEDADQSDVSDEEDKGRPLMKQGETPQDQTEVLKVKEENDNNPDYQEIGPPQFRHVTFM